MNAVSTSKPKVLAVASGGGHWEQMMLLRPMLERFDIHFATTNPRLAEREGLANVHILRDTNRDAPLDALHCAAKAFQIAIKLRPDVVITTGALPGLLCLIAGKLVGARTIWLESVANAEQPSMSGKIARRFVSLWLTQWEHLAQPGSGEYAGALL
jgi:UDP-N-acetylglucosamine:LPS N-acetylglucosamine transferase